MKKLNSNIFFLLILIIFSNCKKERMFDCFKSAGDVITESREAYYFSEIQMDDNVDLVIHYSPTYEIKVTAGENIIGGIIAEQENGKLYLRNENRCNWMRSFENKYIVNIGVPFINKIVYYGSGDISCTDTIHVNEFHFDCTNGSGSINLLLDCQKTYINNHTGRTDIHLKGKSNETYVYLNDVATFESLDLKTPLAYINNRSTGDAKVYVQNQLGVEIAYNGNIYYSGNPAITSQQITGKGKLIHY